MTRILFVCLGNICRSPAAEAILQKKITDHHLDDNVTCESAGTLASHQGSPCDKRMQKELKKRGYLSTTLARPVVAKDYETYNYIFAMDYNNLEDLQSQIPPKSLAHLQLICELAPNREEAEVPDPYYGGSKEFNHVIDILEDATEGILKLVQKN